MDFSTGNSGNKLFQTVTKVGPGCSQEGSYAKFLGPNVCPEVYSVFPEGYTMESLSPIEPNKFALQSIEDLLERRVWNRPALPVSSEIDWKDCLKEYGITVPDWAIPTEFCLVHGDPTVSNCLIKGNSLRLCDPRPPRNYIPQCRETDMGRILQSYMGWEIVAYSKFGFVHPGYNRPEFMLKEDNLKKAIFWCGAAATRILALQYKRNGFTIDNITRWCESVRSYCGV